MKVWDALEQSEPGAAEMDTPGVTGVLIFSVAMAVKLLPQPLLTVHRYLKFWSAADAPEMDNVDVAVPP